MARSQRTEFIGGHVRPEVKKALEEEKQFEDMSVSAILDKILADYFGLDDEPSKDTKSK